MESKSEFIRALEKGNNDLVEQYLDADPSLLLAKLNQDGDLCIHYAAKNGDRNLVLSLCQRSVRLLDKTNNFNETALHFAAREGHLSVVRFFLIEGSNFKKTCNNSVSDNHGKTALDYAVAHKKSDCEAAIKRRMIYVAVKHGDAEALVKNSLIKLAVDRNLRFRDEDLTAFHVACQFGQLEIAQLLFNESPQVLEIKTNKGFSPLMIAAYYGQENLVKYLAGLKVDLDIKTPNSRKDALDLARENGHFACAEALEEAYYIQNVIDLKFISFETIIEKGLFKLAERRIKSDLLDLKIDGRPLFHLVAQKGHLKIAQLLLNKNPDWLNVKDMHNQTALFYAILSNEIPMVEFLINQKIELGLNLQTLTQFDLFSYCNYSDRILNCLILRITEENPELKIVNFVYSGSQALDLMSIKPSLIKVLLEDEKIKTMVEKSSSVDPNQIKFYRERERKRQSGYGIINLEQNTFLGFQPKKPLGKGNLRTVRLFKSPDGQKVAIKSFNENLTPANEKSRKENLQKEMELSIKATPGNSAFALFYVGKNARYVEPYHKGVSPKKFISNIKCEYDLANVILEIVKALQELHAKKIVHGDIYNKNILIRGNPIGVEFIDREHANNINDPEVDKVGGKGQWYAPETCFHFNSQKIKPNFNQDVYSFGVFLDTIFAEHPGFAELVNKFPCIETFIQQSQSLKPEERPTLNVFQQELQDSLSTSRLSLG